MRIPNMKFTAAMDVRNVYESGLITMEGMMLQLIELGVSESSRAFYADRLDQYKKLMKRVDQLIIADREAEAKEDAETRARVAAAAEKRRSESFHVEHKGAS